MTWSSMTRRRTRGPLSPGSRAATWRNQSSLPMRVSLIRWIIHLRKENITRVSEHFYIHILCYSWRKSLVWTVDTLISEERHFPDLSINILFMLLRNTTAVVIMRLGLWPSEFGTSKIVAKRGAKIFGDFVDFGDSNEIAQKWGAKPHLY